MDWQDVSHLLKSSYVCPYNCLWTAIISITWGFFLIFTCKCLPLLQRRVLFKKTNALKVTIFFMLCTA